jgi:hypothetical protein
MYVMSLTNFYIPLQMIGAHLLNRQYHVRKGLKISKWSEAVNRRRKRTDNDPQNSKQQTKD